MHGLSKELSKNTKGVPSKFATHKIGLDPTIPAHQTKSRMNPNYALLEQAQIKRVDLSMETEPKLPRQLDKGLLALLKRYQGRIQGNLSKGFSKDLKQVPTKFATCKLTWIQPSHWLTKLGIG